MRYSISFSPTVRGRALALTLKNALLVTRDARILAGGIWAAVLRPDRFGGAVQPLQDYFLTGWPALFRNRNRCLEDPPASRRPSGIASCTRCKTFTCPGAPAPTGPPILLILLFLSCQAPTASIAPLLSWLAPYDVASQLFRIWAGACHGQCGHHFPQEWWI